MRRVLIVFGVLASGTALSFGAAAAVFLADPDGHMVPNNGGMTRNFAVPGKGMAEPGIAVPMPVPMPMPVEDVIVDGKGALPPDVAAALEAEIEEAANVPPAVDLPPQSGTEP